MAGAHRSSRGGDDVATRAAIVDAASALFVERGYVATTVEDLAVAAGVSADDVLGIVGDKPQLLEAVVERFADDPRLGRAVDEYAELVDPHAIVRSAVRSNRLTTEAFADFYDLIHRTANIDSAVASGADAAEDRMRRTLHLVALRLNELGSLRMPVQQAVDVLAYFLGHLSWRRLVAEFGWSYDDAETWLADRIGDVLIVRGGAHE
jgi:AcrR family transcriptional regulator